jgi:hypothetical protein
MTFETLENILQKDGIVFLTYGGFLTQSLIAGMTDALEKETASNDLSMRVAGNIFTIFIELAQNMMNYSKAKGDSAGFDPKGLIIVGMDRETNSYFIVSRNIIDSHDKEKIEARLALVEGKSKEELRQLYREMRKSGRQKHEKGAGIGFVEVARRCEKIEHEFTPFNASRYYYTFKAYIKNS